MLPMSRKGDAMLIRVKNYLNEPRCEKTGLRVSDQVRHKPGCTVTEDSQRLDISDLGSRRIVLSK